MRELIRRLIRNDVFANVVLVVIILVGFAASRNMVREFFPEFTVDMVMIEVFYPGADPEEVEEGICRKIEEAVDNLEGVKRYTTVSSENVGRAIIQVKEGYDQDEVYERVRNAVDSISTLPVDAEKPVYTQPTIRNEVLYLALWGCQDERTSKEWAERIKDELQQLPGVSQVAVFGARDYEVAIELSEEALRKYGLSFAEVATAVRRGSLNLSAGVIRTQAEEIRLRTMGRAYRGEDFAKIVVLAKPNGDKITLDQIATIRDGFVEDPIEGRFNGEACALLGIFKTPEEDALAIAEAVHSYAEKRNETLPEGINVTAWGDQSVLIRDRIDMLTTNGLQGLALVLLLLWLFLDLRLSFWVGMGIPISLSGAMGLMYVMGATINMVSLFGMILVLGIIVDDAIVVGEAIYYHRKKGDPPLSAAVNGVLEVGMPVIAAVTTTIVAFVPLFYVGGVLGKFVAILPVVVIAALLISLVEALFLLPAHLAHLPDMNRDVGPGHPWKRAALTFRRKMADGMEYFAEHVYQPFARFSVTWRYVSLATAIAILLIAMGVMQAGFVNFTVFPKIDNDYIVATLEFPQGTPFAVTKEAVRFTQEGLERVAERIQTVSGEPLIRNIYAVTGETYEGFEARTGPNRGAVSVELLPTELRGISSDELNILWEKEVGKIPGAVSQTFAGEEQGPPGADIELWLQGERLEVLLAAAEEVKAKLRTYDGVYQVEDDYRAGKSELQFRLKPLARSLGITLEDLARQVHAGYFGEEALRIQRGRDDIRVRVRYAEAERKSVANLRDVRIRTPQGAEVPLYSVAEVAFTQGPAAVIRTDGQRLVTVTCAVDSSRANADKVIADLEESGFLASVMERHPGFAYSFEGPKTDARDAFGGLAIGFPVALFGIYIIIASTFRSYIQPFIIMVTVPFGLIGAVGAHLLFGYDVTMMSVFGMVALSGVVVNDAIVMIECINNFIAKGMPVFEAIARAGARRFRAVFLTTATTVGGLAPIIAEQSMQAKFLIPMAITVAGGVAFATLLTLLFVPCMMAVLNDARRLLHYLRHRRWAAPEEVEPARTRLIDEEIDIPVVPHAEPIVVGK